MNSNASDKDRPSWQLPKGVSRGAWDYVNESSIATDYDSFHRGHPLLELDRDLVLNEAAKLHERFTEDKEQKQPLVALDLGCGTGRSLMPLLAKGWRVCGVDLSQAMLETFAAKIQASSVAADLFERTLLVRGNLAQLDCVADTSVHLGLCLYSSIGMIRGSEHRVAVLKHMARVLKKNGTVVVHVHNRGIWIRDPGGVSRWIQDWWRSRRDQEWEFGDRVYEYRGLPSMFLHIYSERELRLDLKRAGLQVREFRRLDRTSSSYLTSRWMTSIRAGGFIAVATK